MTTQSTWEGNVSVTKEEKFEGEVREEAGNIYFWEATACSMSLWRCMSQFLCSCSFPHAKHCQSIVRVLDCAGLCWTWITLLWSVGIALFSLTPGFRNLDQYLTVIESIPMLSWNGPHLLLFMSFDRKMCIVSTLSLARSCFRLI